MKRFLDVAIINGRVVDGTGNPWFRADVGLKGDRIVKVGRIEPRNARRVIDASDKLVAPGFIDAHSHSDFSIIFDPRCESTIRQGITTMVVGQCGMSLAPVNPESESLLKRFLAPFLARPNIKFPWRTFRQYLAKMNRLKSTSNTVHLVGHGTVRIAAMGFDEREPSHGELEEMKRMVGQAMRAGAAGMSTGLIYPPAVFSRTDEVIELTKVVAKHHGVYFSHIRSEAETLIAAVTEAIRIGEEAGTPVHISHHKASGRPAWGKTKETLQLIESARSRGVDTTYDQYPYAASMTSLATLIPPWAHEGGMDRLLERLKDDQTWMRIRRELEAERSMLVGIGWENVLVSSVRSERLKRIEGKNLPQIAGLLEKKDEATALRDVLLEDHGEATMILFSMDESDVEYVMRGHYHMVGTDSWSVSPAWSGKPHPRFYGSYPRILGKYVREKHILTLEDAIRRMTSFPAQRAVLTRRGQLREGFHADIVIFDPETINDKATYDQPSQFPEGIVNVLVNGQIVLDSGELTKARPGKILTKNTKPKFD